MIELAFRPDPRRPEPLYRQLAAYLRDLVEAGRLVPGQKLPATRELATSLGVSRTTANLAYESLAESGLVRAHVGQGTFVARRAAALPRGAPPSQGLAWEGLFATTARTSHWPARLVPATDAAEIRFDFRPGQVDPDALPRRELRRAFAQVLGDGLDGLANRMEPRGWPPLRAAIARALVARGVACDAEDVLVVGGAQQALERVARALLDPGDAAALEQPGYFGANVAFASAGAVRIGVPVDAEGLHTDALARVLRSRRVKLVYTTPAVQAPTGVVQSDARRAALLALAEEHQTAIVEDDYDSELRTGGPAIPALKTRDDAGRVIYLGTFSKALFPALRIGYVVAARPLQRRLAEMQACAGLGSDLLAQAALTELLEEGVVERHVRRMRRRYADRLRLARAAFAEAMPAGASSIEPAGGNALWATLPPGADAEAIRSDAAAAGIVTGRGEAWWIEDGGAENLLLGIACATPEQITEGIAQLGAIVRRHTPATAGGTGARGGRS